jgi:thiamine biosynthesis lipoprotein
MNAAFRRFLFLGVAAIVILGMAFLPRARNDGTETSATLNIFGTLVEIIIRDVSEATARRAIAALSSDFQDMHRTWHAWEAGGELGDLNKAIAEGRDMAVSPRLSRLIEGAKKYSRLSDGLFNPAIGALIAEWGFHADLPPAGDIPSATAIQRLVAQRPSMDDLIIEGGRVSSRNRSVRLDFGGVAKGAALDLAVTRLKSLGIHNAVVNAGGDLNVMGDHGDRRWRAGIRHPLHGRRPGAFDADPLDAGEGIHTSGNYERYREYEGRRYTHIIDPRTGMPIERIASASVIHTDGALADAAATALCVAGPSEWIRVARRMDIKFAMLVDMDGTVYLTPEMNARIRFEGDPPPKVIIESLSEAGG